MSQIQDVGGHLYVLNSVEFDHSHRSIYGVDHEAQYTSGATLLCFAVFYPLFPSSQTYPVDRLKGHLRVFWVMEFEYDLRSLIQHLPE